MADTISRAYDPPVDGDVVDPVPWNGEINNLLNAHNDLVGNHNDLGDDVHNNDVELAGLTSALAQETQARIAADTAQDETLGDRITDNDTDIASNLAAITALQGGEVGNATFFNVKDITSAVDGNSTNLNSAYSDYNVMNFHTLTDNHTVTLYTPTEFGASPAGRKFYLVNSDLTYGVRAFTSTWHGAGTIAVALKPGEAILVVAVDTASGYKWKIVARGGPDYDKVATTITTGNVTLTEYDKKIQYVELDANRDCFLPEIGTSTDGMEFTIVVGSAGAYSLTLKPNATDPDKLYKNSSDVSSGLAIPDGSMVKLIAIYAFNFAGGGTESAWIVHTY